jgi:hypothetical protein
MTRVVLLVTILCCVASITAVEGSSLQVKPFVGLSLNSYSTSVEDFDAFWGGKSGRSLGGHAGLRFIPQVAGVIKLHVFDRKQEMKLWIQGLSDSVTYKAEWNQYFITVAARYYPVTLARVSPYVDLGFLYSSVTEKYEAIAVEGHGNVTISAGGIGGALGGGVQVWLTPQISVFGEAQIVAVTVKGGNEWLGIRSDRAAGCRFLGGGISLLF